LKDLKIRGQLIRSDVNGLISLTDIWAAAGFTVNQKPGQWQRLDSSQKLMMALMERIVEKSHNSGKIAVKSVYYAKGAGGTFAHPVLACAYAGYLSPRLEVEVREVWLRYRAGDANLADEILEKASPEANEWAGESWPRKFEQADKWSFCLKAAMIAANRREHEQTTAPEP
jgi:hypothetical protein